MQETWVASLAQEDSTCHTATKPVHHNYWACTPRAYDQQQENHWNEKPTSKSSSHSLQPEKYHMQQQGPSTTKKQKQKAMLIILGGQQRDSAMYIHVSILRKLPSHPVCLITLSFLCYTVGPCLSSTLNTSSCQFINGRLICPFNHGSDGYKRYC